MINIRNQATADKIHRGLILGLAVFFLLEFIIHFFGLPILEHDKIFLPTHDRYIALYGLTLGGLLFMTATTHRKDKTLQRFTSLMLLFATLNAVYISVTRSYSENFNVTNLESQLAYLGIGIAVWYLAIRVSGKYAEYRE